MCAVPFPKIVGARDIGGSFAVSFHCSFINTGWLAVALHRAAALYSAVTWVYWLYYVALAE